MRHDGSRQASLPYLVIHHVFGRTTSVIVDHEDQVAFKYA